MDDNTPQPQPLDFSDLGAKTVTPVSSAKLDFSDLGGKMVSPADPRTALSRPDLSAPPGVARPTVNMQQVDAGGNPIQPNQSGMGPAYPLPDISGPVTDAIGNAAKGFVKSAAQTLAPGPQRAAQINAATGMNVPSTSSPGLQTQGLAEGAGSGIEGIGEFLLGDAALKGLPLLQRAESAIKAQRALKTAAEESPLVQQILTLGLKAVRGATASGAQSFLHDPTAASAAAGAAFGAGGELTADAASYGISKLIPRTIEAAKASAAADIAEATSERRFAARKIGNIAADSATNTTKEIISDADNFRDAASELRGAYNPTYNKLREATGGVLNPSTGRYSVNAFDDATQQIARAKKIIYSSSPASTDALKSAESELAEGESKLQGLFDGGSVDKGELGAAQSAWRRASTLDDLHGYIDQAFTEPSSVRKLSGVTPEVDPAKFVQRANKAISNLGPGKLKDAMGEANFNDFQVMRTELSALMDTDNYGKSLEKAARAYLAQNGAPSPLVQRVGAPVAGTSAGVLAHLVGASNPVTAGLATTAGVIRWLYDHPDQGVKVLRLVQKGSPVGAQAAKQAIGGAITHVFDPETETVQPTGQQ